MCANDHAFETQDEAVRMAVEDFQTALLAGDPPATLAALAAELADLTAEYAKMAAERDSGDASTFEA